VDAFRATGAAVILMAIEPPGVNIDAGPWGDFQIATYNTIAARWDAVMETYAHDHPDGVMFEDLRPLVCPENASPCDDVVNGVRMRPDGQHYQGAGLDIIVPKVTAAIGRAAKLEGGSS
jgi:lysophospholipase L1-like esterase